MRLCGMYRIYKVIEVGDLIFIDIWRGSVGKIFFEIFKNFFVVIWEGIGVI